MSDPRSAMDGDDSWAAPRARAALPILLGLAKHGRKLTYTELESQVAERLGVSPAGTVRSYGMVLDKVGNAINKLSDLWQEEIPPPTILIYSKTTGLPSEGVDGFLGRYVTQSLKDKLTDSNRVAMIERATQAVLNYWRWDEVAQYFGIRPLNAPPETKPIDLPAPSPVQAGESEAHRALKEYVAEHPEIFQRFGSFDRGVVEVILLSGDKVDVLFRNDQQTLAVEVKPENAPDGELTRGIFQCVKYRAVLRAMHDLSSELVEVKSVLVTPQHLTTNHQHAADRLQVPVLNIKVKS